MKKFLITEEEKSKILGMHYNAMGKSLVNEVKINGVEYKYPFKDATQLEQYVGMFVLNTNQAIKTVGLNPYEAGDFAEGISAMNQAIIYQPAIEGILPNQLSADKVGPLVSRYPNLTENQKRAVANTLKMPQWSKWYTSMFLPKWKQAYTTVFPAQPATAPTTTQTKM
jgi:hypothetical protein